MHTIWSGHGHHWQKKGKTKNVTHLIWSGLDFQHRQPTDLLAFVAKKPACMLIHAFMRHQMQLFSYLNNGYLHQTMELSTEHNNI
jgi:hypothetical protein